MGAAPRRGGAPGRGTPRRRGIAAARGARRAEPLRSCKAPSPPSRARGIGGGVTQLAGGRQIVFPGAFEGGPEEVVGVVILLVFDAAGDLADLAGADGVDAAAALPFEGPGVGGVGFVEGAGGAAFDGLSEVGDAEGAGEGDEDEVNP